MEEAEIIVRGSSDWAAKTKFLIKKKLDHLQVIHHFTTVNDYTIKSQYPIYLIDKFLETIIQPGYTNWFIVDDLSSY